MILWFIYFEYTCYLKANIKNIHKHHFLRTKQDFPAVPLGNRVIVYNPNVSRFCLSKN